MTNAARRLATARVWITDGSLPVFSDTHQLRAAHRVLFVLRTRYEGFVDEAVDRGSATIIGERPDDALFVEAEWYLEFAEGIARYLATPSLVDDATPIVLQGLIEGKWFNRLLGTRAWRPASLGNNLIAAGAGIATTVGAIERDEARGTVEVSYRYQRGGAEQTQLHSTSVADLRGHNIVGLVREVLRVCRENGETIDGVDLGAVGPNAATVNSRQRLRASIRFDRLPLPNPRYLVDRHAAKERLVRRALDEGFSVPPGNEVMIVTRDGMRAVVGEGRLTWRHPEGRTAED